MLVWDQEYLVILQHVQELKRVNFIRENAIEIVINVCSLWS